MFSFKRPRNFFNKTGTEMAVNEQEILVSCNEGSVFAVFVISISKSVSFEQYCIVLQP